MPASQISLLIKSVLSFSFSFFAYFFFFFIFFIAGISRGPYHPIQSLCSASSILSEELCYQYPLVLILHTFSSS